MGIMQLVGFHRNMGQRFLEHQAALLEFRLPEARAALGEFIVGIHDHIRLEEDVLLPVYEQRCEIPVGGQAEYYRLEHAKIKQSLEQFRQQLAEMNAYQAALKWSVLRLLEDEGRFKCLMEHHDLRERNFLYPLLDQATTPAEQEAMLQGRTPAGAR